MLTRLTLTSHLRSLAFSAGVLGFFLQSNLYNEPNAESRLQHLGATVLSFLATFFVHFETTAPETELILMKLELTDVEWQF